MDVGAFLGGALGVGFAGVVPMLLTDLFPAANRARSIGIAYHAGAAIAAFVPLFIAWLATRVPFALSRSTLIVAVVCQLAVVVVGLTRRRFSRNETPPTETETETETEGAETCLH
jgi:MFS transporter, SHS family, lactate transporter